MIQASAISLVPNWLLGSPQRWVTAFLLSAMLLPPLPIALGNSGPHPALAVAALGIFAGLLRLADWRIRNDGLTRALIAYFLILLASLGPALWYSGWKIAAASLARVFLFGICLYVFFFTAYGPSAVEPAGRRLRILFWAGVASALFACLDFYFQFPAPARYGHQFVSLASGVYRRAQGVFYEASTLGNFCAFFLVMAAVAFVRPAPEAAFSRPALLGGAVVFSVALIFSFSRGSVLNVALALAALLYLERAHIRRGRLVAGVLGTLVAGVAVVYLVFPQFFEAYLWRWWGSALYLFQSPERILSGRVETWRLLGQYGLRHPWQLLIGIGYKTLPYSNLLGRPVVADNMYVSALVETGIAGLAALLLLNLKILQAGYRAARSPHPRTAFFGTWIFCFWVGEVAQMASGDLLTYWRVLPLYLWALAVAASDTRSHSRPIQ
jgi:O-antigen ligase